MESSHFNSSKQSDKRRRRRRKQRPQESSSNSSGSLLWTLLVIGLVCCMVDVVYLLHLLHEKEGVSQTIIHTLEQPPKQPQTPPPNVNRTQILHEKGPILKLLQAAGVPVSIDTEWSLVQELPTWKEVVELYGDKPVVVGDPEECTRFQQATDPAERLVSTAGAFNSGTNLMAELLIANCHMQDRMNKYGGQNRGVRWQVPWGKHTPPGDEEFRQNHKTTHDKELEANNVFPAVTIRDPLVWMTSMCKHHYTAHWNRGGFNNTGEGHPCPDFSLHPLNTRVKYNGFYRHHDSLVHFWNDYYNEYQSVEFPHLLVRFEDLLFHPKQVTTAVCKCAGGSMRRDGRFIYVVTSAKKGPNVHGSNRTGYVDALIRYGSAERRYASYERESDLEYVRNHLDRTLMETLRYPLPDPSKAQEKG